MVKLTVPVPLSEMALLSETEAAPGVMTMRSDAVPLLSEVSVPPLIEPLVLAMIPPLLSPIEPLPLMVIPTLPVRLIELKTTPLLTAVCAPDGFSLAVGADVAAPRSVFGS